MVTKSKRSKRIRILMCPPEYFKSVGPQNARMPKDGRKQPDIKIAMPQWISVFNNYQRSGFQVHLLNPVEYLFDLVFCANGAISQYNPATGKNEAVLSNFLWPTRQLEKPHYRKALRELGYSDENISELPVEIVFEGQGDSTGLEENHIIGSGVRSDLDAAEHVRRLLQIQKRIVTLRLVGSDFYHVDTCFFPLRYKKAIVYYPGAFDGESVDKLRSLKEDKFEVSDSLANHLVCNSVYLEDTIFLNIDFEDYSAESFELSAHGKFLSKDNGDVRYPELLDHDLGYKELLKFIWERGYDIIPVYTSEFAIFGGGGARCLTLFLD